MVLNNTTKNINSMIFDKVLKDGTASLDINTEDIDLSNIKFTASEDMFNVKLSYEKIARPISKMDNVIVKGYYSIEVSSDKIKEGTISFNIDSVWIENNNIDPASIKLYRYSNGAWTALTTIAQDNKYFAYTPGFSEFAIAGNTKIEEPLVEVIVQETNKTDSKGFFSGFTGMLISNIAPQKSALLAGFTVFIVVISFAFVYHNFIKGISFEMSDEDDIVKKEKVKEHNIQKTEEKTVKKSVKESYSEIDRKLDEINRILKELK